MSVATTTEQPHANADPNGTNGGTSTLLVLQLKPIATFKSNDEYLYAMKEDLADWFTCLYKLTITVDNFFEVLETGVMLCEHANKVRRYATERTQKGIQTEMHSNFIRDLKVPQYEVQYRVDVRPQTFQARDNISQFITWTKKLGIPDVLCFETDDLVLRKNEKSVVLCLLEIARVGAKLGMLAPTLVQMEEEIDEELATGEPPKQIKTCDIKSLHEMVQELAGRCTCPVQFPIIKVGEGKYKIGDSQTLVFVRILRNHVMIRVGGGWDTLEHYLDKHDPCRCGFSGHRQTVSRAGGTPARRASTTAVSQSVPTTPRTPRKMSVQPSSTSQRPPSPARMRSMSPSPASSPRKIPSQPVRKVSMPSESIYGNHISDASTGQKSITNNTRRSESPVPAKFRSPSPVSYTNKPSQVTTTTTGSRSQVARPVSPVKSAVPVPRRCTSPSPARRCVSPGPSRHCVSPGPSRRTTSLSTPRVSRLDDRRQLPQRPSMDSSGNDSEETDVTSGSTPNQNNLSLDQISTMTLDEFKSLLNNALSVPNGNTSEGSLDSPRSQSSTDSFKHTYTGRANKKPPLGEATQKYRTWANRKDASRSFDTGTSTSRQDKILKSTQSSDEYYELDRPSRKTTAVARPKTPVSTVPRPKTPVSSVPRPKTPVSSVPRPKTPVSSVQRPKTPVSMSSVSRPKTPTSQFRSTTPVTGSRPATGSVPRPSPGVTRQTAGTSSTSRPKTPTRFQNSRVEPDSSSLGNVNRNLYETEQCSSSLNRTFGEQTRNEMRSSSSFGLSGNDRSENSLNTTGTRTLPSSNSDLSSDTPSTRSERIAEIRSRLAASRYGTESGITSNTAPPASSSSTQYRKGSYDSTAHVSPKPEKTSPNVSYVSITSEVATEAESSKDSYFSKTYQAMLQLNSGSVDPKPVTASGSDVSLSVRSEGSYPNSSVERSYGSSRQSSLSSVDSSSKEEFTSVIKDKINRTQSLDDNLVKKANSYQSSTVDEVPIVPVMNSPEERLARPTTPARPSTPSLIPRPCTPLSSLKDSIHNLEKQPAYSGQSNGPQTGSGRPPTPRKATILAKAPSAANTPKTQTASNNSSYTKMFLAKRSSTPGPTQTTSTVVTPRRSRTPGPGDRDRSLSMSTQKSSKESSSDGYSNGAVEPRTRNVPASPVPQRRARTPSIEHRSLSAQNSTEGETVLTVNRSSGRHVLSLGEAKDTKTPRPSGGRIIARASASTQNQRSTPDVERSRSRARGVTATSTSLRTRPRSVDPESANAKKAEENVLIVQRGENGAHFLNNRTEAWVESAAKNTKAKTPTKSLPPKSVYRRCKTPNPRNIHEHELESRPLEEIKAALSLPINGLKEVDLSDLDAPPEDADAYAKMDELFRRLKAKELRASVNETPGGHGDLTRKASTDQDDSDVASGDVCSLDSNENVKRKSSKSSFKSSPSTSNRGSTPSTPSRPKTPSFPPKEAETSRQFTRANSMPPRPSTPTRTSVSRRSSSNSAHSAPAPETDIKRSASDHTSMLVSKIKELINTKPRKDDKSGPKSRIPAPKSLSSIGKSKSVSNLLSSSNSENISPNKRISNGDLSQTYDFSDDLCGEISKYSSHDQLDYNGYNGTTRNGTETPVPKLSTPLTTGRKEFLNNQRENTRTPKLVRAVSIGSLSSSSNTLSCTVGDDEDYV